MIADDFVTTKRAGKTEIRPREREFGPVLGCHGQAGKDCFSFADNQCRFKLIPWKCLDLAPVGDRQFGTNRPREIDMKSRQAARGV